MRSVVNLAVEGELDGDAVKLQQGVYRVRVNSAAPRTFGEVRVEDESDLVLRLE